MATRRERRPRAQPPKQRPQSPRIAGLFTESEAQLARQVEYLSRTYAVVVTNPPYMGSKNMDATLSEFAKDNYPTTKSDLFAMFIERCLGLTLGGGQVAMITMQSWMFLSSYEKLRGWLLHQSTIGTMAHLGARAFDSIGGEVVQSTAFVLGKGWVNGEGVFIRLVDGGNEAEKSSTLHNAASNPSDVGRHQVFGSAFEAIPGTPIVYWLSEKMRSAFAMGRPLSSVATTRLGMTTADNARFTRQWSEISWADLATRAKDVDEFIGSCRSWVPYNKGGEFRKWFGNSGTVLFWRGNGADIRSFGSETGRVRSTVPNEDFYFRPALTWSKVSSGQVAFRWLPPGFIFDVAGAEVFSDVISLALLVSTLNSEVTSHLLAALSPTLNFEGGQVSSLPIVVTDNEQFLRMTRMLVTASKVDWDDFETSWDFRGNMLVEGFRSLIAE